MMQPSEDHRKDHIQSSAGKLRLYILPCLGILIGLICIIIAWQIAHRPTAGLDFIRSADIQNNANQSPDASPLKQSLSQEDIDRFTQEEALPQIERFNKRNEEAIERALATFETEFQRFEHGIPDFTDDISSWGTRFEIMGKGVSDFWNKHWKDDSSSDKVGTVIQSKFHQHIFSAQDLQHLVDNVTKQFISDLQANQNQLHTSIKTAWEQADYTSGELEVQAVIDKVDQKLTKSFEDMGLGSMQIGVASGFGGFLLGEMATKLVHRLLTRIATSAATSGVLNSASSSGVILGSAQAGAIGGSAVGPLGTIAGLGAGVTVGLVFEHMMSEHFQEKIVQECEDLLQNTKQHLRYGSEQNPGLQYAFETTKRELEQAELHVLKLKLQEVIS